ncbi:MAG: hydantoinase/oxoprolinase family protein [Burkholderiaceae bacterium]
MPAHPMSRPASARRYRIGVDIGGTFTDVVLVDEASGEMLVVKVPSRPEDPSRGFMDGLSKALGDFEIDPEAVSFLVHGTTVATNAIIQGKVARAGLITCEGFSDVLEIGYQTRPVLYDIFYRKPPPLVPRHLCRGVPHRIDADGEVVVALDEAALRDVVDEFRREKVQAIVVAFLHSYKEPVHERRARELIAAQWPGMPVILSSDVCPEYHEYPRTSTAVINGVLVPIIAPYIDRLQTSLLESGVSAGLHLMTSGGGIYAATSAKRLPAHLVESGPAAGVIGAAFVSQLAGCNRILALDIGGTTAKAALVEEGRPVLASEFEVGAAAVPTSTSGRGQGYPLKTPVISLVEIGAGGGSIAYIDPGGALSVGPDSAGADPGPACYGRGGTRPTLTDANLVLGRVNPDYFLGGALPIDADLAYRAIERHVAAPLGVDVVHAARLIVDIADSKMTSALQFVSIQRGIDPRQYTLVPSGGAGPLHAAGIARLLGVRTILVPPTPGLNSAVGLLATDLKHEFVQTFVKPLNSIELSTLFRAFDELREPARELLEDEGVARERMSFSLEVDMRYRGQGYSLRIAFPGGPGIDVAAELGRAFDDAHEETYGFANPGEVKEIVNLRLTGTGAVDRPRFRPIPEGDGRAERAVKGRRRVHFGASDALADCPIYERSRLLAGDTIDGPAVIEQMDTTTVLPPRMQARLDCHGNLLISTDREAWPLDALPANAFQTR